MFFICNSLNAYRKGQIFPISHKHWEEEVFNSLPSVYKTGHQQSWGENLNVRLSFLRNLITQQFHCVTRSSLRQFLEAKYNSIRKTGSLQRPIAIPQHPFPSRILQVSSAQATILGEISGSPYTHLQCDFGIHNFYLHGDHLWNYFILKKGAKVGKERHEELCCVTVDQHMKEAILNSEWWMHSSIRSYFKT